MSICIELCLLIDELNRTLAVRPLARPRRGVWQSLAGFATLLNVLPAVASVRSS